MYRISSDLTKLTRLALKRMSICVLIGMVYYVLAPKWLESIQLAPDNISEDKNRGIALDRAAAATNTSPTVEYHDGWKIISDERLLRAEVENIHNSNYNVKDGDKCTKSIPDFILVGVAKCGTEEFLELLSIHPNIIIKKDPYKLHPADKQKVIDKMPCKYHDQLSGFKMDTGLISISAPDQIYKLNPKIKIMAIIREPISRIISGLTFIHHPNANPGKNVIGESKAMKTYMQNLINETVYNNNPNFKVKQSTYDLGTERFLKKFKQDNVLVVESGEYQKNPVKVLKTVEQFLGISSFISDQHFALNSKKQFYCIRKTPAESKTMVCYQSNRGRKLIELDEDDKEKLATYFRPHNENLFQLLGKRFDW